MGFCGFKLQTPCRLFYTQNVRKTKIKVALIYNDPTMTDPPFFAFVIGITGRRSVFVISVIDSHTYYYTIFSYILLQGFRNLYNHFHSIVVLFSVSILTYYSYVVLMQKPNEVLYFGRSENYENEKYCRHYDDCRHCCNYEFNGRTKVTIYYYYYSATEFKILFTGENPRRNQRKLW